MKTMVQLLELPWLARVPSRLGWAMVLAGLIILVNIAMAAHGWNRLEQLGIGVLALAIVIVWITVPNVLWLVRDTTSLRIPGAAREIDRCPLLYAAVSIILPGLVLGAIFGHALTWLVSLTLVASGAAAIRLLPNWLAGLLLLLFIVITWMASAGTLRVPLPGDPAYLAWATPVTIIFGVVCAQRWSTLPQADLSSTGHWWLPGSHLARLARIRVLREGNATPTYWNRHTLGTRPEPSRLPPSFGPTFPVHSILLAINPMAGPRVQRAMLRTVALLLAAAVVFLVLLARHVFPATARATIAQLLPIIGTICLSGGFGKLASSIVSRWSGHHAELSVLALLPNLGTPAESKPATLLAGLYAPASWSVSMLLLAGLTAALLRMPMATYPLLAVVAVSGLVLDGATITHAMAGRSLHGFMRYAPRAAACALLLATAVLWGTALPDDASMSLAPHGESLLWASVALWAAWLALLLVFAHCGWRLLQRRPHPFLANPMQ